MKSFKVWLEGEYGQGFAGSMIPTYTKSTAAQQLKYAKQGIRSNYTAIDMEKKLPPNNGRQPLGNINVRRGG